MPCFEREYPKIDPAILQKVYDQENAFLQCRLKNKDEVIDKDSKVKACTERIPDIARDAKEVVCLNLKLLSSMFQYQA